MGFGAGVCPLMGGVGSQLLWLQNPRGPGSSACVLVFGAGFCPLWWGGPCSGVIVGLAGGLKAACLLVGGAVSPPS